MGDLSAVAMLAVAAAVMARGGDANDAERVWYGLQNKQLPLSAGEAFEHLDLQIAHIIGPPPPGCVCPECSRSVGGSQ